MTDSDRTMTTSPWPSLRGLWGLLWHSMLFLPVAVILYAAWFFIWASVFTLPVIAVFALVFGDWLYAAESCALWVPLLFLSRWKRLHVNSKDTLDWKNGNI
ncbi:MAG TPA: hypothetical protein VGJ73_08180 [Verrucomicrobiae bacterium]